MMFYLLLVFTLTTAMPKKAFYNPVQVYYQSTSIPASSHAIIINPKANPKQNIADCSHKLKNKSLPDYKIPKWVYEKVFRHNKPHFYKFDEE
jgi:hypothetical protein